MRTHRIEVSERLVAPVARGGCDTIVLASRGGAIRPGDALTLVDADDEVVADATVRVALKGDVDAVAEAIEEFGWQYPYTDPDAIEDVLDGRLDTPSTPSRVAGIHFETDA